MIVDDSLSCLTKSTIIVLDSFPQNRWARLKWPPRVPREVSASEIHIYIQGDNHDKKTLKTKITQRRCLPKKASTRKN